MRRMSSDQSRTKRWGLQCGCVCVGWGGVVVVVVVVCGGCCGHGCGGWDEGDVEGVKDVFGGWM